MHAWRKVALQVHFRDVLGAVELTSKMFNLFTRMVLVLATRIPLLPDSYYLDYHFDCCCGCI